MQDKHGNTPLHLAALGGHADVLGLLLACEGPPVDVRNKSGQLPVHCAALGGEGCMWLTGWLHTQRAGWF